MSLLRYMYFVIDLLGKNCNIVPYSTMFLVKGSVVPEAPSQYQCDGVFPWSRRLRGEQQSRHGEETHLRLAIGAWLWVVMDTFDVLYCTSSRREL